MEWKSTMQMSFTLFCLDKGHCWLYTQVHVLYYEYEIWYGTLILTWFFPQQGTSSIIHSIMCLGLDKKSK